MHGEETTSRGAGRVWLWLFVVVVAVHLAALYWPRVGLLAGVRPAYLLVPLALHAPVSELLQHAVLPNRSGDVWDAVADLAGVVVGATIGMVSRTRARW